MAVREVGVRVVVQNVTQYRNAMSLVRREASLTAGSMVNLSRSSRAAGNAVTSFGRTISQVGNNIRVVGNQIAFTGLRLSLLLSAPFLGATAAIAKTGATFERELVKIETLVGINQRQVEDWGDQILDVAADLGQLPTDLAEGLFFITSAGIRDSVEAMDALTIASKASAVGLGTVEDVADALTSAMLVFGDSAERAGDTLLLTAREGKTEVDRLGRSFGRVLGTAEIAGLSFEEVGAFVATFTRTGVEAQVAVTSLRAALQNILKPTNQAKEALASVGLSIEDVRTSIEEKGFARTMIGLREVFGDNTDALAAFIGSQRALAGILTVTGPLAEDYLDILDSIEGGTGELEKAFERVTETLDFQWKRFLATLNVFAQEVGKVVVPALNDILDSLTPIIASITELLENTPGLVKIGLVLGAIAAAVGPLLFIFGTIISTFGNAIVLVGNLVSIFGALLSSWTVLLPVGAALGAIALTVAAAFGVRLKGRINEFTNSLEQAQRRAGSFSADLEDRVLSTNQKVQNSWRQLAEDAATWGANVIIAFANGMIRAAIFVINAVIEIANAIANLLRPGSPPKVLPDLTEWGTEAVNAWLEGWTAGDFGVFDDIASTIESHIRAVGGATGAGGVSIGEQLLEARGIIGDILLEFQRTGEVGAAAFDRLSEAITHNSDLIVGYVKNMLDLEAANQAVTAAQENLNAVEQEYEEILSPLQRQIEDIERAQAKIDTNRQIEQLQRIIRDVRTPAHVRRQAQLEIERLRTAEEIRDVEAERDVAVSEAQQELDTAITTRDAIQERLDAQVALLNVLNDERSIMAEILSAAEKIKQATEETGAGELAAGGGIIPTPEAPDTTGLDELVQESLPDFESLDLFSGFVERIKEGIGPALDDLTTALQDLTEALDNLGTAANERGPDFERFKDRVFALIGLPYEKLNDAWENFRSLLKEIDILMGLVLPDFDALSIVLGVLTFPLAVLSGIAQLFAVYLDALVEVARGGLTVWRKWISRLGPLIEKVKEFDGTIQGLEEIITGFISASGLAFEEWVGTIIGFFEDLFTGVVQIFIDLYNELIGESWIVDLMDDAIEEFKRIFDVPEIIRDALITGADSAVGRFKEFVNDIVGPNGVISGFIVDVVAFFQGLDDSIITAIDGWANQPNNIFVRFYNLGLDLVENITDAIKDFNLVEWILDQIGRAANAAKSLIDVIFGGSGGDNNDPGGGPQNEIIGGGNGRQVGGLFANAADQLSGAGAGGGPIAPTVSQIVAGGDVVNVNVNMGGQVINNDMDARQLAVIVRKEIVRSIR